MSTAWRVARLASFVAAATSVELTVSPRLAGAQAQWTLVEELRIGAAETDATTFADIRGVAIGANGQIFVLEYRTQEIRAFDAQGKFIKNVARKGGGPGEISNANGLRHGPGGTIWVNDPANSRFTVFAPDGAFSKQYTVPINSYGFIWEGVIDAANRVYETISVGSGDTRVAKVRRITLPAVKIDSLDYPCGDARGKLWQAKSKNAGMVMAIPFSPRPIALLDARGFMWCSPGSPYRIAKLRLGTPDTVAVIGRKLPPVPVPRAERDAQLARLDSIVRRYDSNDIDHSQVPDVKPAIVWLDVDESGRLWVRRSTNEPSVTVFDVFDGAGELLATARAPFKIRDFSRPVIRGDVVYAAVADDDDVQYVVRARIRK